MTIDKSGANTAALEALQEEVGRAIEIRQSKYLNNLVEQDRRGIKRIIRPMLGFKSFRSVNVTLLRYRVYAMNKKGQMIIVDGQNLSADEQFYFFAV